jgi:DNA-binding response OmpR family regulator
MSRILIVEDEERIIEFLQRGLAARGYTTRVVRDGNAARREALRSDVDLIVLDLGLPGADGLEVLRDPS